MHKSGDVALRVRGPAPFNNWRTRDCGVRRPVPTAAHMGHRLASAVAFAHATFKVARTLEDTQAAAGLPTCARTAMSIPSIAARTGVPPARYAERLGGHATLTAQWRAVCAPAGCAATAALPHTAAACLSRQPDPARLLGRSRARPACSAAAGLTEPRSPAGGRPSPDQVGDSPSLGQRCDTTAS